MRTPVNRLYGKARQREDTPEDFLADKLSKTYTVVRDKTLEYKDANGNKQSTTADIVIPAHKLIVEIQKKQDDKTIIAEMARDRVARECGWRVCRITDREAMSDDVLYYINREIERGKR